jgi:hypothetical protein
MAIAKNEYRIRTSSIRKMRLILPVLLLALLAIIVVFLAPGAANLVYDAIDMPAFFISIAALAFMQIMLFMFFFYFILFPVSNTLKDINTAEYEIFLSAPVKPSDVLIGKFMGAMPFYAVGIAAVAAFFTAFLVPIGIDLIQTTVIIAVFVITFLSALWIGAVIAALLKTKLGRSARGKDIGKALSLIIALPLVALMYAVMGGGLLEALADPGASGFVKSILAIFPSSWGAELFILFAFHPGNIAAVGLEIVTRFGGLLLFFVASLWIGGKLADRVYTLETTTFTAAVAKSEGAFYRFVRSVGGGKSFGTLLVSIFKDYGRRFENLSKIAYIVGLLVLITVFFGNSEDSLGALIMGIFIFPFLVVFVVGEVTIRGKENLFIYRKAPLGENRYVKARLLQGWIMTIPIATGYAIFSLILVPQTSLVSLLAHTGILILIVAAYVVFALGLFLLMPVFTDKPAELMVNAIAVQFSAIGLFGVSQVITGSFSAGILTYLLILGILGIVILNLGRRNLSRIE